MIYDPNSCDLVSKAAKVWLLQSNLDMSMEVTAEMQKRKAAEKLALQYMDWLVSTINESVPDTTWRAPVPHPCTLTITSINQASDEDYHNLTNTVE